MARAGSLLRIEPLAPVGTTRDLPPALRRDERAAVYLAADRARDHAAAATAATSAMEQAVLDQAWWPADIWGHRALWHYEQAEMTLEAVRAARLIGDVRAAAGDPDSARRYYAEAIGEARDIGAELEQGLASLGLGRALLERGEVTTARRMGAAALTLLDRVGAPTTEIELARQLIGTEVVVGERTEETE